MPKKGSRTITVAGKRYHWKVITPRVVREMVEEALAKGWDPGGESGISNFPLPPVSLFHRCGAEAEPYGSAK